MSQDNDNIGTSFDMTDLVIRKRVEAYNAALDANNNAATDVKDGLLSQLAREVGNLQAQLAQVEKAFGKNDAMARVLREAVESAQCRLDTRQIELQMEREDAEEAERAPAKSPMQDQVFTRAATQEKSNNGLVASLAFFPTFGTNPGVWGLRPTR